MNDDRSLRRADLPADPFDMLRDWLATAVAAGTAEPTAMTVATIGPDGGPTARVVLLKRITDDGLLFATNYESAKAADVRAAPRAAAVLWWDRPRRQIRVCGRVEPATAADSDRIFAARPRASKIAAWASPQSRVIADRADLDARVRTMETRFADGEPPRPPFWGAYRLLPETFEFWQGRASRLHDRFRYGRDGTAWRIERLAP